MYLYFLKLIYRNFLLKKKIPKWDNDDIPYFEKNIIITGKTGTYKTRKVLSRYNNYFYLDISITSRPESLKIYSQWSSVINHIVYRIIIYIYNGIILDDFQFITTDMLGMFEWQNFKNSHVIIISTQSLIDISKLHDKLFNNKLDKFINHIVHTNNLVTEEMRNNNIIEIKFLQHLLEFHLSIIEDSRLVDNMRSQINDNYVNSIFIRWHYIWKEYTNNDTYDKNIKLMEELTINYPDFKGEYFINHIDYLLVKYWRYWIIKTYELNKSYFIDNDLLLHEKYLIEDLYRLSNYDDKILMNEDWEKRNRFFKKVSEMIDCS